MHWRHKRGLLLWLAWGVWVSVASAEASDNACKVGQLTTLAVQSCANVWPPDDAKFRWPDLRATCDPKDHLCDSADANISKSLPAQECKKLRILDVLEEDHLARVRCEQGSYEEYLINLDSISCHPRNILKYGSPHRSEAAGASRLAGERIVNRAEARMRAMRDLIAEDTRVVQSMIHETKPEAFLDRVRVVHQKVDEWAKQIQRIRRLDERCEVLDPAEKLSDDAVRAQRTCRLLVGAHGAGTSLVKEAESTALAGSMREAAAVVKIRLLRRVSAKNPYQQADALYARMFAFQALLPANPGLPKSLKLIRLARESGVSALWELHAGFVFGGSRLAGNSGGGYDCSDFMASLLPGYKPEKSGPISTHTLKKVARYLVKDPADSALTGPAKQLAGCFVAVDLRAGEALQPGDFVISNNDALKGGHVAVVKRWLSPSSIVTIEATGGGANTIMSKARPLHEPVPQCSLHRKMRKNRQQAGEIDRSDKIGRSPIRPDLYVLRIRIPPLPDCPLSSESFEATASDPNAAKVERSSIPKAIMSRPSKK